MEQQTVRSLEEIWPLQGELNRRAGFDTEGIGRRVRAVEGGCASEDAEDARVQAGRALKNYIDALAAECHELQECLSWKHWYREAKTGKQYQLQDIQNARVEAADMLFFWVSICQLLGLEAEDVYRLYSKKLVINHRRQDEDRAQNEHGSHEDENREVV